MPKMFLTNAKVYSFNTEHVVADSVGITNGKISKVGKADDVLASRNRLEPIVDLRQSLLFPGFTDSHIHLLAYGQYLQRVDLSGCTKQECLIRVSKNISQTQPGEWIIGHGWDHNLWESGFGSIIDLDQISSQHPIYLTHKSLHCAWANSTALQNAGITNEMPDPPGGVIGRGEKDIPKGILLENAMQLVESAIPEPDSHQMRSALHTAQHSLNKFGITSVHDFDRWLALTEFKKIVQDQNSTLRMTKGIPRIRIDEAIADNLSSGDGDEWIKIGWLKLFSDGALGSQTAAMLAPYSGSNNLGMLLLEKEEIVEFGTKVLPKGIALAIHAIGDRANKTVLSSFELLSNLELLQIPLLPSRIEHVQIISNEDLPKFKPFNIVASMQPIHAVSDSEMAQAYWGERCQNAYAWRSLLDQDAKIIFGSDAPVESPNPFYGIAASISRQILSSHKSPYDKGGWITQQCINLKDSLVAYCQTPSQIGGFDHSTGAIAAGKFADLVVLPANFMNFSPAEIYQTKPIATMVDGKWVYKNDKIDIEFI